MGGWGVQNWPKVDGVICARSLIVSLFRAIFHPEVGFSELVSSSQRKFSTRNMNKKYNWAGLVPDIFESLAASLNFTFSLDLPRDGRWGAEDDAGQWSGIFSDLMDDEADIAPASLAILETRSSVVDFLLPFYRTSATFVIKTELPLPWRIFLSPFKLLTWVVVFLSGCVLAVMLASLVKYRIDESYEEFTIVKCFIYVFGAFSGFAVRRWTHTPFTLSAR